MSVWQWQGRRKSDTGVTDLTDEGGERVTPDSLLRNAFQRATNFWKKPRLKSDEKSHRILDEDLFWSSPKFRRIVSPLKAQISRIKH